MPNSHFYPLIKVALFLTTFSFSCYCSAKNNSSKDGSSLNATELEILTVTASRQAIALMDTTSSLSVVSADELETISHTHINEALARMPGTWISRGNGQEHLTAIRSPVFTGAGACGAFFMAEDGIGLRAAGFCNVNQLFDANTEQAERIEVVRGPGSVLYGSNAVHGIINIISPELFKQTIDTISLERGPDNYWRGRFSFSSVAAQTPANLTQHAFAWYGNLTHDGGFQVDSGFDQQKINLLHQYQADGFSAKSLLSMANINQETAGFIQGKDAFRDKQLRRSNANPEAFRDSLSWRAYTRLNWDLSDYLPNDAQLSFTPYVRMTEMEFIQHFVPWQPIEKSAHHSIGLKSLYSQSSAPTPSGSIFNWHSGIDIEYTQGELSETQSLDFSATIPQGKHYDYQVDNLILSPFMDFIWTLAAKASSWKTSINVGVRYDHIRYDYNNLLSDGSACAPQISNCRFFRPRDQQRSFSRWSPRLSILRAFDPPGRSQRLVWYAELSRGFRAPQATELFRLQAGQQSADVKTEQLDSLQLGHRGQWRNLHYDLSGYYMKKRHFIFRDSKRQVLGNGQSSHRGIELALDYNLNEHWQLSFSGSHAQHRYENDIRLSAISIQGNNIDTAPKNMANARLSWSPSLDVSWEMEWVHLGAYFLNPENTARYEGHELLNLRAKFKLGDRIKLNIKLINLADTDYAERADFAFGQYRYFVGKPRSIFLTLAYLLD